MKNYFPNSRNKNSQKFEFFREQRNIFLKDGITGITRSTYLPSSRESIPDNSPQKAKLKQSVDAKQNSQINNLNKRVTAIEKEKLDLIKENSQLKNSLKDAHKQNPTAYKKAVEKAHYTLSAKLSGTRPLADKYNSFKNNETIQAMVAKGEKEGATFDRDTGAFYDNNPLSGFGDEIDVDWMNTEFKGMLEKLSKGHEQKIIDRNLTTEERNRVYGDNKQNNRVGRSVKTQNYQPKPSAVSALLGNNKPKAIKQKAPTQQAYTLTQQSKPSSYNKGIKGNEKIQSTPNSFSTYKKYLNTFLNPQKKLTASYLPNISPELQKNILPIFNDTNFKKNIRNLLEKNPEQNKRTVIKVFEIIQNIMTGKQIDKQQVSQILNTPFANNIFSETRDALSRHQPELKNIKKYALKKTKELYPPHQTIATSLINKLPESLNAKTITEVLDAKDGGIYAGAKLFFQSFFS